MPVVFILNLTYTEGNVKTTHLKRHSKLGQAKYNQAQEEVFGVSQHQIQLLQQAYRAASGYPSVLCPKKKLPPQWWEWNFSVSSTFRHKVKFPALFRYIIH